MQAVEHDFHTDEIDPIDIVETLAEHRDWEFDRVDDHQIAMAVEGQWRTYAVTLAWSRHDETLRLVCTFEMAPPEARRAALREAVAEANDRLWTGGFGFWPEEELMAFRYALTLAGGAMATPAQIDAMIRAAVGSCERFYPAFQLVAWGEETPEDALGVAMTEAYGRA
jgi:hypothetical protein